MSSEEEEAWPPVVKSSAKNVRRSYRLKALHPDEEELNDLWKQVSMTTPPTGKREAGINRAKPKAKTKARAVGANPATTPVQSKARRKALSKTHDRALKSSSNTFLRKQVAATRKV